LSLSSLPLLITFDFDSNCIYLQVAMALLGGPKPDRSCYLYAFDMTLSCPITEEQNTRGRPIHAPEDTARGFGLLCERQLPLVCRCRQLCSLLNADYCCSEVCC